MTMTVATIPKAVIGSYWNPNQNAASNPMRSCSHTAMCGERYLGWTLVRTAGSSRTRPMANHVRVAAFEPALELAIVEFTMAKNTKTQAPPHTVRAMAGQLSPARNLVIRFGPKNTVAAYVVST